MKKQLFWTKKSISKITGNDGKRGVRIPYQHWVQTYNKIFAKKILAWYEIYNKAISRPFLVRVRGVALNSQG